MADLVSVVIPTFNRREDVLDAVRSVLAQDYPHFEVVLVDNNSTDGTAEAVQALARDDPRLRYCFERVPGVGAAHNRGAREAQGELVAFLDDDEIAPPQWLSTLVRAQSETGGDGIGGPYEPIWLTPPPRWLLKSRCMQETISFMDFGSKRQPIEWLLGGNAMYTRQALESADYYGEWASYTSKRSLVGGGDIVIGQRMRRAGLQLWFEPAAVVGHKVPRSRMRLSYILRRAFWAGYTDVAIGQEWKLGDKAGKALTRGLDAIALGAVILPGTLWGRLMVRLGYLQPLQSTP